MLYLLFMIEIFANPSPLCYSFCFVIVLHQWKKTKGVGSAPCLSGHTASVVSL